MGPKLHVLQEEGVGGNTMPARRVEVSGVTAPLELRKTLGRLPAEMKVRLMNEHEFRDRLGDSSGEPAPLAAPRSQRQRHQDRGPTEAR